MGSLFSGPKMPQSDKNLEMQIAQREEAERKRAERLKREEASKRMAATSASSGYRSLLSGSETGIISEEDGKTKRTKIGG